jgi:hypothetical protein
MEIYETKTVTEKQSVITGYRCDACNAYFLPSDPPLYKVDANHEEWGRDSVDSDETLSICNDVHCYLKALEAFLASFNRYAASAVIDGKPYSMIEGIVERLGSN